MTTQEYIQKEADAYYKNPREGHHFADGLFSGIELAKEFTEWVDARCTMMDKGWVELEEVLDPSYFTTSELFEIFLTERNEK